MNNKQWQIGAVKVDGQTIISAYGGVTILRIDLLAKEQGATLGSINERSVLWALNIK